MKRLFSVLQFYFIFLIITSPYSFAQTRIGAPNEALGNATSTTSNLWSIWANPGGISGQKLHSFAISYRAVQNIQGLNITSFAAVLPLKKGVLGLGVSRFGDALFNQQQINLSYGNKFGITDLGIKLAYHQYHFEGFGSKGVPVISFGGITSITSKFFIGAFIENINQGKISDFQDERLPTIMQAGISYRPLKIISINLDIQKDIEFNASILFGVSYTIINNLIVKSGFNSSPATQFFGLDFIPNNLNGILSYAISNQQILGFSHQVSLQYHFKTKR